MMSYLVLIKSLDLTKSSSLCNEKTYIWYDISEIE